jgi:hypothetical protein
LDQSGRPQSIIVFGKGKYLHQQESAYAYSQRAKIVGGMVVQYCKYYPCNHKKSWTSRLILVGVNPNDPKFENTSDIEKLRKQVDWNYVRAFLENYRGRTVLANKEYPAYRIVGEVSPIKAGRYAFQKGYLFDINKMNLMRKQCYKLYDYIWSNMEEIRKYKQSQEKKKNAVAESNKSMFYKNKFGSNVIADDINQIQKMDDNKSLDHHIEFNGDFSAFFLHLMNNYQGPLRTCLEYVQASSINSNKRRHWTFAFLENFINLNNLDQSYRCLNKVWIDNPTLVSGKKQYQDDYRYCTIDALNRGMERGINRMSVMKKRGINHYQYIQYDNGSGGTHEKIYSWVKGSGKDLSCRVDEKKDKNIDEDRVILSKDIFPLDVSWEFFPDEKTIGKQKSILVN